MSVRVIGREAKTREVELRQLDLAALRDLEAKRLIDIEQLFNRAADRVLTARGRRTTWQRDVERQA